MKLSNVTLFFFWCALAAGLLLGGWLVPRAADYLARGTAVLEAEEMMPVEEIFRPVPSSVPFAACLRAEGYIELAAEPLPLSPLRAGLVARVHVEPEQRVGANQVLISLNVEKTEGRQAEAEARLANTQARLKTERLKESELAERYERVRRLVAMEAAAPQELNEFSYQLRLCRARIEEFKTLRRLHQAQLDQAGAEAGQHDLRAPVAGRVWRVAATPGMYLEPVPGQPAVVLAPDSTLAVRVLVREEDAPRLRERARAVAFQPGEGGAMFELAYLRTEPEALLMEAELGPPQRMIQLVYRVIGEDVPLVVGQSVEVYVESRVHSSRVTEPTLPAS
ncbi:MAG: HlyD family efflux transporter periplasmic adaptor subunit [Verrucomicrobiota bacterium]